MRSLAPALIRLLACLVIALFLTLIVLAIAGVPPWRTLEVLLVGGVGSAAKITQAFGVWVPLLLCSAALLLAFAAGLWNIGIEGQIIVGAIAATGVLRPFPTGGGVPLICLALVAGMAGGALWALLAAILRTWGRVHEIFAGLGLNFVALGLTLWLIFGPWKRPGIASMSGTEPLHRSLWLPTFPGLSLSPVSLILAIAGLILVVVVLNHSQWGLRLRAVGQNPRAAILFGLEPNRRLVEALVSCGALAGLAGALQVLGVYHRLLPAISSQYGYTALLIAMLASFKARLLPLICLFFAVLNVGSIQLPLQLRLDSSLAGVIQGALVLSFFLVQGLEKRYFGGQEKGGMATAISGMPEQGQGTK